MAYTQNGVVEGSVACGVQAEGVKSKRHMKLMLQDLKKRGWVTTKPPPADSARRDRAFRYLLTPKSTARNPPAPASEVVGS